MQFSNIFACHVVKHKIPIHSAQTQKEQKDAFSLLWKTGAFKPRVRQTTKAVMRLEISEKTLKRRDLNKFCPSFPSQSTLVELHNIALVHRGQHCLANNPQPPTHSMAERAFWYSRHVFPPGYFVFYSVLFCFSECCQSLSSLHHLPPFGKGKMQARREKIPQLVQSMQGWFVFSLMGYDCHCWSAFRPRLHVIRADLIWAFTHYALMESTLDTKVPQMFWASITLTAWRLPNFSSI